jgi:isoleucyl-tRNA synthetase
MPELERLMLHHLYEMDQSVRGDIEAHNYGDLAQKLHLFCNNELSAFYFDIRKDSLYCDAPDDPKRRAARTVMFHIFECLTAWFAPILAFTAEEAWQYRPKGFDDAPSVHLRTFPKIPANWKDEPLAMQWIRIKQARDAVLAAIEPLRKDKIIGSSLEAVAHLSANKDYADVWKNEDLAEVCITSQMVLDLKGDDPKATVKKAEGCKCNRCWKVLPEVGQDKEHPTLCQRCANAVRSLGNKKAA